MMKPILSCLLCLILSTELIAAPRLRPRVRYRPRPPQRSASFSVVKDTITGLSWKVVLAGGAATAGIVFAYKIGDGLQKGTIEAARKAPDVFLERTTGQNVLPWVAAAIVLLTIGYLVWHFSLHRRLLPRKECE